MIWTWFFEWFLNKEIQLSGIPVGYILNKKEHPKNPSWKKKKKKQKKAFR